VWADTATCWLFERNIDELLKVNFFAVLTELSQRFLHRKFGNSILSEEQGDKSRVLTYSIQRKIISKYYSTFDKLTKVLTSKIRKVILTDEKNQSFRYGIYLQTRMATEKTMAHFDVESCEESKSTPSFKAKVTLLTHYREGESNVMQGERSLPQGQISELKIKQEIQEFAPH
jgi:hypothetical protein